MGGSGGGGGAALVAFLENPKAVAAAVRATSARVANAVNAAIKALGNPDCAGLFNLDPNAPAPAALLGMIGSGSDPNTYFTEEYIVPRSAGTMTNATTSPTAYSLQNGQVELTGVANKAVVAFNYLPSAPFNTGTVTDNAVTVLHELGHVFELLYGLGSTYLVNDSVSGQGNIGQANAASAYNTLLAKTHCFPGQ